MSEKHLKKEYILKRTKKAILIAFFLFIALILLFFVFRNTILNKIVKKTITKIETRYNAKVQITNCHFTKLFTVHIDELKAVSDGISFYSKNMDVRPSIIRVLTGSVHVNSLSIDSMNVLVSKDITSKKDTIKNTNDSTNLLQKSVIRLYHVFDKMLQYGKRIPPTLSVKKLHASLQSDSVNYVLDISELSKKNDKTYCHIKDNKTNDFTLEGTSDFSSDRMLIEGKLNTKTPLKITYKKTYILFNYPVLKMEINKKDDKFYFNHFSSDSTFQVFDSRLASDTVSFTNLDMKYEGWFDTTGFYLDSNSYFKNKNLIIYAGGNIGLNPVKIDWRSKIERMPAQDFFSSLPEGFFYKINTVQAKGDVSYKMRFIYDERDKNNLVFDSDLTGYDLQIDRKSVGWITNVYNPFMYIARTGKGIETTKLIDPTAGDYVPFELLSKDLINAVLINEDPSFFYHKGFVMEAFKGSIVDNIKSGYFKRGGSTISMQLVKNLYLNRGKTISRKVEEIMIVWLIENQRLLSKEKMMELYFNIIEFGPGVYGLAQASQFYFSKSPSQLTKNECIFLANIIPRPKAFRYAFNGDGTFRPWMQDKANLVNRLMVLRNMSPPTDTSNYNPNIVLNGSAAKMVIIDTVNIDSILIENDLND